jgi:hypothetical protein
MTSRAAQAAWFSVATGRVAERVSAARRWFARVAFAVTVEEPEAMLFLRTEPAMISPKSPSSPASTPAWDSGYKPFFYGFQPYSLGDCRNTAVTMGNHPENSRGNTTQWGSFSNHPLLMGYSLADSLLPMNSRVGNDAVWVKGTMQKDNGQPLWKAGRYVERKNGPEAIS